MNCKSNTSGGGGSGPGQAVIDYAEQWLYSSTNTCTHDFCGKFPNLTDITVYADYNCGYDCNCANFVTACLVNTGQMAKHFIAVSDIKNYCRSGQEGYREIDPHNAQAGDIWYTADGQGSHTELVVRVEGNQLLLIGSNNFGAGDNPSCKKQGCSDSSTEYQGVSYAYKPIGTGIVCSKR